MGAGGRVALCGGQNELHYMHMSCGSKGGVGAAVGLNYWGFWLWLFGRWMTSICLLASFQKGFSDTDT